MVYDCPHCDRPTHFIIDKVHVLPDEGPPEEFSFAHCESCSHPAVFLREDVGDGFQNDTYYRVYPPHDRHIGFILPQVVRDSYEEAVRCETAKASIACAVMVGRTLEAVCKAYTPNATSIYQGLRTLHTNGVISQELLDWADHLRVIRNLGAHAGSAAVSRRDAQEALDFLQAILEILYYLRPKFEDIRSRQNAPGA